jgi:iron complex transport system permease protein
MEGRSDRPAAVRLFGEREPPGRPRGRAISLLAGTAVLLIVALLAVAWGSFSIPPGDVAGILWRRLTGAAAASVYPASWDTVILEIRLPRVILAALVGAALAPAGAVYQGLFRNPLADPYLIGVSSGAGLGATIAIVFGVQFRWEGLGAVSLFAFGGALAATVLVYGLSRMGGRVSVATLLLAGVALGAFLTSFTTYLMFRAPDAFRTVHVVGWLMGSFALASWPRVSLLAPFALVGGFLLWTYAHRLNVLQLDEDQARQLGIPLTRTRLVLIVLVSLVMAAAVSVSGVIGFVGLIIPHAVRLVWGPDHRFLLPMSAVGGGLFMILADGLARMLLSPAELPVGVVTAFCGAPFFLYLLRQRRHLAYY